jgi:16S rRNA A1518/A1519 N6-dimethyltransferase RsmA/KsgA/DIM1 with predicted DNA glycosylase/AP lyase activity
MPSSKKARQAMLQLVSEIGTRTDTRTKTKAGPIFELGSGWGSLLIPLAKKYPQRTIIGYELSIMPWLTTVILKNLLGLKNIQVHRKNFLHSDLTSGSVILCYLFPKGMEELESKIKLQRGQLEYLISNNFALPSHQPIKTIQLNDLYQSPVYLYQLTGQK